MKITLRILRIICKLLLLAYVTVVNLIFITVFYVLILGIFHLIFPTYYAELSSGALGSHLINTLPFYLLLLHILYCLSPIKVWFLRRAEGFKPLTGNEQARINRLLAEMGIEKKLNLYCNRDARPNAAAFGFNTIGITGGLMQQASDEELKGVICHEIGHIAHYDYVYQVLIYSMEAFGYRCLYGIYFIPAYLFGIIGGFIFGLVPALSFVGRLIGELWNAAYKLVHKVIYGISHLLSVNINKYAEYRCDAHSLKYGCGEGLLYFLRRLKWTEETYGERMSFTEYIMSTHPATEKRVKRLEKLLN
nr:M48 family metalloprotease [Bacteroides intestinalis]